MYELNRGRQEFRQTAPYASDVLLADTQLLFGSEDFPSEVFHARVANAATMRLLWPEVSLGAPRAFYPSDSVFQSLVNTCGTNGNVMLHYVQDASTLDPSYTYFIASILVADADDEVYPTVDITFRIGRRLDAFDEVCAPTLPNGAGAPPSPPGASGLQGCCFGAALDWSPGSRAW